MHTALSPHGRLKIVAKSVRMMGRAADSLTPNTMAVAIQTLSATSKRRVVLVVGVTFAHLALLGIRQLQALPHHPPQLPTLAS